MSADLPFSAAAERNKSAILEVLVNWLPATGLVLEVASGTGQHMAHFSKAMPGLDWQPSDPDAQMRESVRARVASANLANVREPIDLDVRRLPWPISRADVVQCINMVHIAPWAATESLFTGARQVLVPGGVVFLYGPYRRFGRHTAPSNEAFDAQLRAADPAWGVRDLEAVVDVADAAGFDVAQIVDMPANNFSVVLKARP